MKEHDANDDDEHDDENNVDDDEVDSDDEHGSSFFVCVLQDPTGNADDTLS